MLKKYTEPSDDQLKIIMNTKAFTNKVPFTANQYNKAVKTKEISKNKKDQLKLQTQGDKKTTKV